MKILLLNSPWLNNENEYGIKAGTRWAAIRRKENSMPYFPFPYFLASAAAVLKKEGFQAQIKDAVAEEMKKDECLDYIRKLMPDILVVEAFTPSIYEDLAFMKEAKAETNCLNIFCGAHPTALPEEILNNDFMDFVLLGEYDYTLRELAGFIKAKRDDFEKINGLAYKENGVIKINARRKPIEDLDGLPFPERDELPMNKYTEPFSKYYPNAKVTTSRGCPYNCIFCIEPFMYGEHTYRKRSVGLVMEEIKLLRAKFKIREIYFDDPIFTIARGVEIAQAILNDKIKIAWSCWMDWRIGPEELTLLKKSGCIGIKFGIESSSRQILDKAQKSVTMDKINVLIKNCKKLGMLRHASFMFGLPGETPGTLRDTLDLAFSLDLTSCQLAIATPLPGTPFYKMAEANGWLVTKDWARFEPHYSCVVGYPGCGSREIEGGISLARQKKVKQLLRNPAAMAAYIIKLYRLKGAREFLRELSRKGKFAFKAVFSKK